MTISSLTRISNIFNHFTDLDGLPLENGYIYIGEPNLNPETNPIDVYWNTGKTIDTAQPIRTVSGYPSFNGAPGKLYIDQDTYSITIRDKNRQLLFTDLSYTSIIFQGFVVSVDTYSDLLDVDTSRYTQAVVLGFYSVGDGGGGIFIFNSIGDAADHDGGIVIDPNIGVVPGATGWWTASTGTGIWKRIFGGGHIEAVWFGAKFDGSTDDQECLNALTGFSYRTIILPAGDASISVKWSIPGGYEIIGQGTTSDQKWTSITPTAAVTTGIEIQHASNSTNGSEFRHLTVDMVNMSTGGSIGIHINGNWYNTLKDVYVDNTALVANNVGILLQSTTGFGTFLTSFELVRTRGNEAAGTYEAGTAGLKLLGTVGPPVNRVTSLLMNMCAFGEAENAVESDYSGAGIVCNYLYLNDCDYGWLSTNHAGTELIQIFGGEITADTYGVSGSVLAFDVTFNGGGDDLEPNTGARVYARGTFGIGGQSITAADDTIYPDYGILKVTPDADYTLSSNPQIAAGYPGQVIKLEGTSNSDILTLIDGNGLELSSNIFNFTDGTTLTLAYDNGSSTWIELSRNTPSGAFNTSQSGGGTLVTRRYNGSFVEIEVTDGTAFNIGAPTDGNDGDTITFSIYNNTGGAMGAVTFVATYIHDGTYADPATGKRVTITFTKHTDGNWYQTAGPSGEM